MIRNIVLDLGGVLFTLDREEALRRFDALGVPDVEKMLDPYLQSGYFLQVEDGRMTEPEFRAALSASAGRELTYDEIAHAYFGFLRSVDSYKFDFVDEELKDYRIFILSNTNPYVMDFCESDRFLPSGRPLSSFCVKKFASCDMGLVKPDRRIFERMISEGEMKPEETLFLDDGPANVAMAAEFGIHTYCPKNGEDWREPVRQLLRELNAQQA
mgnify:FL=1